MLSLMFIGLFFISVHIYQYKKKPENSCLGDRISDINDKMLSTICVLFVQVSKFLMELWEDKEIRFDAPIM